MPFVLGAVAVFSTDRRMFGSPTVSKSIALFTSTMWGSASQDKSNVLDFYFFILRALIAIKSTIPMVLETAEGGFHQIIYSIIRITATWFEYIYHIYK